MKPLVMEPGEVGLVEGAVSLASRDFLTGRRRVWLLALGLLGLTLAVAYLAVALGVYGLSPRAVLEALLGREQGRAALVVWNIRLPRIAAALTMGWALGLAGLGTMSLLKNPLASPFTLGISQAAAFGAAVAIVAFGAGSLRNSALLGQGGGYWSLGNAYLILPTDGGQFVKRLVWTRRLMG